MVNSIALEGDGCNICSEAEAELLEISQKLNCSREVGEHLNARVLLFWRLLRARSLRFVSCPRLSSPFPSYPSGDAGLLG